MTRMGAGSGVRAASARWGAVLTIGCWLAGCHSSDAPPQAPGTKQKAPGEPAAETPRSAEAPAKPKPAPASPPALGPRYLDSSWARAQQQTDAAAAQRAEALRAEGHSLYKA